MTQIAANPYLDGNFAPVRTEITADNLKVLGKLPADLSGMFVRNGANPQFPPIGRYHWFDGDGMLHGVQISNGKATYRNRFVQTRGFKIERDAGKAIWTGIFEPPSQNSPYEPFKNTANTALTWHAGKLLALWEGGEPHLIKAPNLDTIGPYNYDGKLASAFTAHPKVDPVTGEMMFFGYSLAAPPYLHYSLVSSSGELLWTVPIELPVGVMMHDFAISEHYTIFMDLPLTFRLERMQRGEPAFMFESDRPSRFGILPRHGDNSNIQWFEASTCFIPHTLNAYEEGDEVVLIACRMHNAGIVESADIEHDSPENSRPLYQWRFNLRTGAVKEEILNNLNSEFPRVNEQLLGRKTRYGYAARIAPNPVLLFDGLIKYDFSTGKSQVHEFGTRRYGGDVVFVPSDNATAEDEGWLITFVHDESTDTSELLVVDAQNITAEPVARVIIPQRVPYGFHALWLSEQQLANSL